jgi:hypothetical protein
MRLLSTHGFEIGTRLVMPGSRNGSIAWSEVETTSSPFANGSLVCSLYIRSFAASIQAHLRHAGFRYVFIRHTLMFSW